MDDFKQLRRDIDAILSIDSFSIYLRHNSIVNGIMYSLDAIDKIMILDYAYLKDVNYAISNFEEAIKYIEKLINETGERSAAIGNFNDNYDALYQNIDSVIKKVYAIRNNNVLEGEFSLYDYYNFCLIAIIYAIMSIETLIAGDKMNVLDSVNYLGGAIKSLKSVS